MNRIGITEAGDAGIHFSWVSRMNEVSAAILITKNINDKFIGYVNKFKDKTIIHATITGWGSTKLEPSVIPCKKAFLQLQKLIDSGFPKDQIVLRIDPIIPSQEGLDRARAVLNLNLTTVNIKRVRVSLIDMYPHVRRRFAIAGISDPYLGRFSPADNQIKSVQNLLEEYKNSFDFECCAEDLKINNKSISLGCISKKDLEVLGLNTDLYGFSRQRVKCLCPANKLELLYKRMQCQHGCLYCYWNNTY